MQNTDEKTKSNPKKILFTMVCIIIIACTLIFSFGEGLGLPNWNDVFAFCGISADLGDEFSASFVNVGTADACCIRCFDKNILIDCGVGVTDERLSSYFRRNNFEKFDAVIISHADADHYGGMTEILKSVRVDKIYMPAISDELVPNNNSYNKFINSVKENKIEIINPKIRSEIKVGELILEFISPQKEYENRNDNSLVTKITYGKNSFLFTGDISEKVEKDLINSDIELNSDVLKVAHHGSKSSSSEDFLKAVSPHISVVSVSVSDDNLPDYTVMARLNHFSDSLYSTGTDKTVVITSDGTNLKVQTKG